MLLGSYCECSARETVGKNEGRDDRVFGDVELEVQEFLGTPRP
jgi:hypothetical protein